MHPTLRSDPGYRQLIALALAEDIGRGDATSDLLIPEAQQARLEFRNRGPMAVAGLFLIEDVLAAQSVHATAELKVEDAQWLESPHTLAVVTGNARELLTVERVMLNFLQRACGVATLTHAYVQAAMGTQVQILDTRKTLPGFRLLDKYAVTCGGGHNHRMRLDDRILIKDNHIALCGGIAPAVEKARAGNREGLLIEVECDTLEQVREAAALQVDWILLDNMPPQTLREAVGMTAGRAKLEASGGVSLQTVRSIAETGVDAISAGALTHSAPAADIGLDIALK